MKAEIQAERLLTRTEVAAMFRVDEETVSRWARAGLFPEGAILVTPGGHRRYREPAVRKLLDGNSKSREGDVK
jgi:predicted site-specific integrase-resolvase